MKIFALIQSPEQGRPPTRGEKAFAIIMVVVLATTLLGSILSVFLWPEPRTFVWLLASVVAAVIWCRETMSIVRVEVPSVLPDEAEEDR